MKTSVFTNIKNGAILMNIFIVNTPPLPTSISQDYKEIIVVGRHPDCNITITHPSINRFHLQFHLNPSIQNLSFIDLSSGIKVSIFDWYKTKPAGFFVSMTSLFSTVEYLLEWCRWVHLLIEAELSNRVSI